ncbi:MAG TPA: hypothetical protein VG916_08615 [Gemmatimonadaceae bacterium]|nr:hypothetical protein [Gemmatimonadaceae bacterium]
MSVAQKLVRAALASAAATTFVAAAPVHAQSHAYAASTASTAAVAPPAATTPATRAHPVSPAVDDARRLYEEGRWREARQAFDRAVDAAKAEGEYGRDALEGLAIVRYMLDDVRGAARSFDELGERAAAYGDPDTELTAFFKSALLYQEAGDRVSAAARVPRIKTLLKSPVISDATRRMVQDRID